MSKTAHTDEIDALVSSVRDFVSHKEPTRQRPLETAQRLVLTDEQRVAEPEATQTPLVVDDKPAEDSNILMLNATKLADRAGLEATIAELEAAVTAQPDEWEAEEGEDFEGAAWAVSAFHAPESDSPNKPSLTSGIGEEILTSVLNNGVEQQIATDVAGAINEESLRALVIAIVREELAGEMGERITRNVRKLVRREINRTLLSREMTQD